MKTIKKEQLIKQLEKYGFKNLTSLNKEELLKMFKEASKKWTTNIISISNRNVTIKTDGINQISNKIKSINDISSLYETLDKLLIEYAYSDIKEAIINDLKSNIFDEGIIILDIKYIQYLENMVEEIENKIKIMPIEEIYTFLDFIESNNNNIQYLKLILNMLNNNSILQTIKYTTNAKKYILKNFIPNDLESNYKQYYNNSKEKQDLIKQLKNMNAVYTRKQLDNMTKNDLIDVINSIKQKELDEKKDKEDFDKYSFLLKQALYKDDNDNFNTLVIQILEDVSNDCLSQIKSYLKTQDPLFDNKFKKAQIEWQELKTNNKYK